MRHIKRLSMYLLIYTFGIVGIFEFCKGRIPAVRITNISEGGIICSTSGVSPLKIKPGQTRTILKSSSGTYRDWGDKKLLIRFIGGHDQFKILQSEAKGKKVYLIFERNQGSKLYPKPYIVNNIESDAIVKEMLPTIEE